MKSADELDGFKQQVKVLEREKFRLQKLFQYQKQEKELEITSLKTTIQNISNRSSADHKANQIISLSNDLHMEKLTCFHLRQEIDDLRQFLEFEKEQKKELQGNFNNVQFKLNNQQLFKTIIDIPGVPPLKVLEVFSVDFMKKSSEIDKLKRSVEEYQEEIKQLQNVLKSKEKDSNPPINDLNAPLTTSSLAPDLKTIGSDTSRSARYDEILERKFVKQSSSPRKIKIGNETTPKSLLESLRSVDLESKLESQEHIISYLEEEIKMLSQKSRNVIDDFGRNESAGALIAQEFAIVSRKELFEQENKAKRLDHLLINYEDLKKELDAAKKLNLSLQNSEMELLLTNIHAGPKNLQARVSDENQSLNSLPNQGLDLQDEFPLLGAAQATSGEEAKTLTVKYGHLQKELENCKFTLSERTSQLNVLMETLDALQLADSTSLEFGIPPKETDTNNLFELAYGKIEPQQVAGMKSSPWVIQSLTKRIIELTAELSSTISQHQAEKQLSENYNHQLVTQQHELNKLKAKCLHHEKDILSQKETIEQLIAEKRDYATQFMRETHQLKLENDEYISKLRENEIEMSNLHLQINELKNELQIKTHSDVQEIISSVPALREFPSFSIENVASNSVTEVENDTSGLKDLLTELLLFWKEKEKNSLGLFDGQNSSLLNSKVAKILTKAEKEFFQRVSDLVLQANARVVEAQKKLYYSQRELRQNEETRKQFQNCILLCTKEMIQMQQRITLYEKSYKDFKGSVVKGSSGTTELLAMKLREEKQARDLLNQEKSTLSKKYLLMKLYYAVLLKEKKHLALQSAIYESKWDGDSKRESRLESLHESIEAKERQFMRYIDTELPRIMCGLPVNEVDRYFNNIGDEFGEFRSFLQFDNNDKVFPVIKALAYSKAAESKKEMKITELTERVAFLQEKHSAMETVLLKWKEDIESDLSDHVHSKTSRSLKDLISETEKNIAIVQEKEVLYRRELAEKERLLLEREEENIELRNKFQLKCIQCQQLQLLVDNSVENDEILKQKAVQQLNKLRYDLETEHADELRKIREFYEGEKREFLGELTHLSAAIITDKDEGPEMEEKSRSYTDIPPRISKYKQKQPERAPSSSTSGFDLLSSNDIISRSKVDSTNTKLVDKNDSSRNDTSIDLLSQEQKNEEFNKFFEDRGEKVVSLEEKSEGMKEEAPLNSSKTSSQTLPLSQPVSQPLSQPLTQYAGSVSSVSLSQKSEKANPVVSASVADENKENAINTTGSTKFSSANIKTEKESLLPPRPTLPTVRVTEKEIQTDVIRETSRPEKQKIYENEAKPKLDREMGQQYREIETEKERLEKEIIFEKIPRFLQERHSNHSSSSSASSIRFDFPLGPTFSVAFDDVSSDNNTLKANIEAIEKYNEVSTNQSKDITTSDLIANLQNDNFQRTLELQKRRNIELTKEIKELEEMIAVQNRYIRQNISQPGSRIKSTNRYEEEINKEDRSLWPSASLLADELLTLLQTLLSR